MTDLKQLIEAGALGVAKSLWQIEPRVRVDSLTTEEEELIARAAILAILPLLADDLAGVCAGLGRPVGGGDGGTYTIGTAFDAAQAIRTRLAAIMEGEG